MVAKVADHGLTVEPYAVKSVGRSHTRLASINPTSRETTRSTGRVTDITGRRPVKPITFDSAL